MYLHSLGPQVPAAASTGAHDREEEANQAAGATDGSAKAADEPASTMAGDSDGAGTPAAQTRGGPVTAPLPPLARNEVRAADSRSPRAVGEQALERSRPSLMVVGIVIGIVLVVLVSITLVYGFSGSRGPKTPEIASPAQTATARSLSLALSPTTGFTAQPTKTALPIVAATTTPPPTSTTVHIDTPTATTTPRATPVPISTATSAPVPSATPSSASLTYVVQPGDTLTYIARSFGTTVDALMAANGLTSTEITVGQVLKIP